MKTSFVHRTSSLCPFILSFCALFFCLGAKAQNSDHIGDALTSVATMAGEARSPEVADSTALVPVKKVPVWKQKLYYGYNFDIYFHSDSRANTKELGWSIALTPEIGWRLSERIHLGVRVGGSYQNIRTEYSVKIPELDTTYTTLRIHQGSWEITPYARYRLKTVFNGKVGIWLEAHLYTGMSFPRVADEDLKHVKGTDYDGLRHSVTYGFQLSPVITYQFNRKSTFQIFFSILSVGYSGTAFFYQDPITAERRTEYTNDVIVFSGKLRNLLANQFTPGLYGLKFGVQKSF